MLEIKFSRLLLCYLQDKIANPAHPASILCPTLVCPQKSLRELNILHILMMPLSIKDEKGCHMMERHFVVFHHSINMQCTRKNLALSKLKVSKSQNKFMRSSFLPKYKRNILRISALASKERSNKKGTLLY